MRDQGGWRRERKGGHQRRRTHGLPSIVLADCSERMRDASAQGAERIDHVYMKARTKSGVEKNAKWKRYGGMEQPSNGLTKRGGEVS